MVLQSIKSIFALLILIGMGFYFAGKKWFGKNGMDFLSKFTVEATLPFYMFYNIYRDLESRERLLFLITKVRLFSGSDGKGVPQQGGQAGYFYRGSGFPECRFYRISCDPGALGRGDHFRRRDLLYREHSPLLDAGDQSAATGRKKRQECEMGAEYQKSVLPDGRRNVSWNGSSLFQDRSP